LVPLDLSEILSRFILQTNWFSSLENRVKYAAFMPNRNGETSVFRTSSITNDEIWNIGDREVSIKRGKPILGRADIRTNNVISKDLQVVPKEPPVRHANIIGWPDERSKQRLIAIELAAESLLHIR
jgi:hypothetical protein